MENATPSLAPSEYLVLSRGQWDAYHTKEEIQAAIDQFYSWIGGMIDAGKMRPGQRLGTGGVVVDKTKAILDGPFGEAKEVVGGYWFIIAGSLQEAAELISANPCLPYGLSMEIRPLELVKATAFHVTNETPAEYLQA